MIRTEMKANEVNQILYNKVFFIHNQLQIFISLSHLYLYINTEITSFHTFVYFYF